MTVKELIERLLDEPMNSEVMIHTPIKHIDRFGQEVNGYAFHIDDVERWSKYTTFLNFIDYRKGADDE